MHTNKGSEGSMLAMEGISFAYGTRSIFDGLWLHFEPGCFYGIIGPNGSGKSTLLDLLSGYLTPQRGAVRLAGRPLKTYAPKERARWIGLVPQTLNLDFAFTCAEVVMMGRHPHIPRFGRPGDEDRRVVARVMEEARLFPLAGRDVSRLSGGERQRVVFARALAQEAKVLLLDEATAHLDMHHAIGLLNLAAQRAARGVLVIAVMQDVNLAAMYCDRLVCLREGRVYAAGATAQVLTMETLRAVFRVDARLIAVPGQKTQRVVLTKGSI